MTTPQFRTMANQVLTTDLIITPRFMSYFNSGRFPHKVDASLIDRHREREPDGWFHPSTHPGWSERALYLYLTDPSRLAPRTWDYSGRLSANIGTMTHELVKAALIDDGILMRPIGDTCDVCGQTRSTRSKNRCNEHGFADPVTGSRGHVDGVLNPQFAPGTGGFDLKTTNERSLSRLADNDVDYLRVKWPYYYDQMQDYMRISGLRYFVVFFLAMGWPWECKEVRVDYDVQRAFQIEHKYLRVRKAAQEGNFPGDCCRFESEKKAAKCVSYDHCRGLAGGAAK